MKEIGKKFLPIGTVVMLENGKKRIMITGFCQKEASQKEDKIWDYNGCLYPEGILYSNQSLLFDHSQIKEVYFKGLEDDDEEKEFKAQLTEFIKNIDK